MTQRLAFYYPWYPETWGDGTHYQPSLGQYSSLLGTFQEHVLAMKYAKLDGAIVSWWGKGSHTDTRIPALLNSPGPDRFKFALYYENEGYQAPSAAQLSSDLAYIAANYAHHVNYLHRDGKPVIFAYAGPDDGEDMAQRWATANHQFNDRFHVCLKVYAGYETSLFPPASWHQYDPANRTDHQIGQSFTVSPGFFFAKDTAPRLDRNVAEFVAACQAMKASGEYWQLVTTFNEWGEGTAIEPELGWGLRYLDVLRETA